MRSIARCSSMLMAGWMMLSAWSAPAYAMSPKEIYKKAAPAVVLLFASDGGAGGAGGTGSIISADGRILTNAHVVLNERGEPYKTLYVFLKPPKVTGDNGKDLTQRFRGEVISFSAPDELDLAIVQIKGFSGSLPTIGLADPNGVEVGDAVVAIGHPEQGGLWTLTSGTVSTVMANLGNVKGKDVFQTDTAINPGNSGGPLLDTNGNIIGINSVIARVGANGEAITGVNYALKSSVAHLWLETKRGMHLAYVATPSSSSSPTAIASQNGSGQASIGTTSVPESVAANGTGPTIASAVQGGAGVRPLGGVAGAGTRPVKAEKGGEDMPADAGAGSSSTHSPSSSSSSAAAAAASPAQPVDVTQSIATAKEQVIAGKRLDLSKVKPNMVIKTKPYRLDDLRRRTMRELEEMMDEMRGRLQKKGMQELKSKGNGMGLW